MHTALRPLILLLAVAGVAALLSIGCGSIGCEFDASWQDPTRVLRAQRTSLAFAVGALLSLTGALLQLLLRNPLADPYVFGISGGAAVGAVFAGLLLPAAFLSASLQAGALAGALLAIAALFILARPSLLLPPLPAAVPGVRLILTGVMVSTGFGALLTLLLSLAPDSQLRGTLFWLMGDLDAESYGLSAWIVLLGVGIWAVRQSPRLNVLAHGDTTALLLGLPVTRLRVTILLVASLATAAAVALVGAIGFVGLVVPHALRLWLGNDQRLLLPAAMLGGGAALLLADLIARTALAPVQLPVGVVTALAGVPLFLLMLSRLR
jgi:iron complex transport system permease protein